MVARWIPDTLKQSPTRFPQFANNGAEAFHLPHPCPSDCPGRARPPALAFHFSTSGASSKEQFMHRTVYFAIERQEKPRENPCRL